MCNHINKFARLEREIVFKKNTINFGSCMKGGRMNLNILKYVLGWISHN